jgi:dolichol-phosphate mannosyltransferase
VSRTVSGSGEEPEFSIVVPLRNESANLEYLISGIEAVCAGRRFEAVMVDDGSDDDTGELLDQYARQRPWIRVVRHPAASGQTAAIHSGVTAARSSVICTMDGDGQNPPSEIPRLVAALVAGSSATGLVAGQRKTRKDSWSKRAASRFANALRGWLLRDGTRDTGCGLKAFHREDFLALPYFDHMHRFLPALFRAGGHEVRLIDVAHAERHAGRSNYTNLQRALVGVTDLVGVMWLIRRRKRVHSSDIRWPDGKTSRVVRHPQHPRHGMDGGRAERPADVFGPLPDPVDHL